MSSPLARSTGLTWKTLWSVADGELCSRWRGQVTPRAPSPALATRLAELTRETYGPDALETAYLLGHQKTLAPLVRATLEAHPDLFPGLRPLPSDS